MTELKKISQTIDRKEEHPVGNKGVIAGMKRRLNYVWDKIFDELTASVTFSHEFETSQIVQFLPFDLRTIQRRFLWKKRQKKKTTFDSCYNHNDLNNYN